MLWTIAAVLFSRVQNRLTAISEPSTRRNRDSLVMLAARARQLRQFL